LGGKRESPFDSGKTQDFPENRHNQKLSDTNTAKPHKTTYKNRIKILTINRINSIKYPQYSDGLRYCRNPHRVIHSDYHSLTAIPFTLSQIY
jgi:hypothetical protein